MREWVSSRRWAVGLAAVTVVAVVVRLVWVGWVQAPSAAVFSDMRGYMDRACIASGGRELPPDRAHILALWPFGAHSWYGWLLWTLGPDTCGVDRKLGWTGGSLWWVDRAHAISAALVAPFAFAATRHITDNLRAATTAGIVTALWPPLLTFVGFYSSEAPYAVLITASLWLGARIDAEGRGALALGLGLALAATVRPVALLAAALAVPWLVARLWGRWRLAGRRVAALLLPLVVVLSLSSWRFHELTGRWGLISANGAIAELFAITEVKTIGNHPRKGFHPPARGAGYEGHFGFKGKITDEAPVRAEIARVKATLGVGDRHRLIRRNVRLLFAGNLLWPERRSIRYARDAGERRPGRHRWRIDALPTYEGLGLALVAMAAAGAVRAVSARKAGAEFALLHIATVLYAAAFYYGEVRYRVPYDAAFIVLAAGVVVPMGDARRQAMALALVAVGLAVWLAS